MGKLYSISFYQKLFSAYTPDYSMGITPIGSGLSALRDIIARHENTA